MSEKTREVFTYVGARLFDRELSYGLMDDTRTTRWWGKKSGKHLNRYSPGDNVSVETERKEDGTVVLALGTFQYEGQYHDDEERAEWAGLSRAAKTEDRMRRSRKNRDALREALEPVREIYWKTRGATRSAMLAEIINILEGRQ